MIWNFDYSRQKRQSQNFEGEIYDNSRIICEVKEIVNYQNIKKSLFYQEYLGGSLFNILDFFTSRDCSLLGGVSNFENANVVNDTGRIQNAVASLLVGQEVSFFVDAKSKEEPFLFMYGESENSDEILFHFNNSTQDVFKCLTYSTDGSGNLVTEAVSCDSRHSPLCVKGINIESVQEKCQECNPEDSSELKCQEWVDLDLFSEAGYVITETQLCTKPCGLVNFYEAENYCQVKANP